MKKAQIVDIEDKFREADFSNKSEDYNKIYDYLKTSFKGKEDYLVYYFQGLASYSNPDIDTIRIKLAIENFEKSLGLSSEFVMSKIYLAYCYYDLGSYSKSVNLFKGILGDESNWEKFNGSEDSWRIVNLAEMVAVCYLKLAKLKKYEDYYVIWKDLFYLLIRKDNFYFPESLVVETSLYLKEYGESIENEKSLTFFRRASLDLIGIIKGGNGFEEIYHEELENLKNWDGQKEYRYNNAYAQ